MEKILIRAVIHYEENMFSSGSNLVSLSLLVLSDSVNLKPGRNRPTMWEYKEK
jgi:hypothetical protein